MVQVAYRLRLRGGAGTMVVSGKPQGSGEHPSHQCFGPLIRGPAEGETRVCVP